MKHLKTIFACLLMAVLSIGQVWAAEQLAYTLAPAAGSNNSYASACDVTISGITWNVTGNAQQVPWRIGGKSLNGVNRAVYSKTAMSDAITKVELTVGAASSITVNSLKLVVASNADFSSVIDEVTETFAANSTITFTPTSPATEWSTGAYYKFIFNVSVSGTSNKFVAFTEAKFYKEVATATCETPTFSPAAGTFFGEQEITITTNTAGASIYYTTDGTTPSSSNGTLYDDPFSIDETTTIKAIAVKAGASDSEVAEATYTAGTPVSTFDIDFETNNLAAYVNWNFVNIASTTTTITAYAGTYYGKTSGTASASITTKAKYANPGLLTFYTSKESGNNTTSSWIVQVSEDGEDWSTEIATFDATTGDKGTWTAREADLSGHTNVYVRIAYSGSTAIRAIDNISLANASEIAKPTISGDENFLTSTEVSIACSTGGVTIYYTNDGTDPKTSDTKQTYSDPFSINETTTIRAIANLGAAWSAEATSKTFTKITPITVAAAIAAIPNKDDVVNDQYVAGIVCTAAPSLLSGGKLTYYISADGSETNRLQIYKGKNLNNTEFTAVSDLAIGDRVVVFGQLKNYNGTPEMNDGNYLVSKEGPAVAAPEFTPNGGGFMGETDVTITCSTAGSTIYYTLDETTPSKSSSVYSTPIHLDATTTITAVAYVGDDASLVIAKTFTLTAPMTVAEALAALESDDPINNVAVAGIISTAPTANPSSGKLTYYISDDGSASDELEVYKGFGIGGASFSDKADLQVGDEVTVFGNLTIYNTTKEFAEGSRLIAFNRPQVDVESINLTESTAEVEEGKTVTLHASVVPANATNKTIVWTVESGNDKASVADGVVTGIAAGTAVIRAASDEDATIFAECTVTVTEPAPLSPWASVYTSNVEIASNTAAHVTINEEDFDAAKTSKGASATITLPQGVTTIHLHLVAWSGEAQTVSVTGDCFNEAKELTIVANDGVAGSGTTYDLGESGTDYYFSLTPDNEVAANTVITIAAASGKRFVLFGVNQEGAVTLESISVSGTATALEYNDGDHFSPAGLGVTGHYSDASTAPITEGIVWAFDPDPLTEGTESVSVTATAGGFTSAAFVVDGLTVAGAAPLSPWASVYTSNVEIASNTAAHVTINEENFDAAKTSKGASATITLPQGVTTIHLHLVAWSGEAQTVSVTGDCFNEAKELSIEANAGVSGSGTTYDLGESGTDYYFSLTPDNEVAANTVITIAAASGKRFVLFGVNQEGGVLPVLESIEIKGDLTTKTGYKAGDALNLDGLTVEATYSIGGVAQTPVDITNDPELAMTYDPLVEDQTEVTITASYKGQTDDITITGLDPVASADPKIYVSTLNVNFASVEVGESVPAAETVTVTLTNVASVTATLGGTNADAFSVSPASLTESGDITISILANTDAAASYAATLTISDGEGGADDKVVNLSFTVNEPVTPEDPEVRKTWDLSIASYDANPTEEQVTWSATYVNMVADKFNSSTAANNYLGGDANNRTSSRFYKYSKLTITPNDKEIISVVFTATSESYANALQGSEWTNASASVDGTTITVTPTDGKNAIIAVVGGTCGFTAVQVNYKNIAPEPPTPAYTDIRTGLTVCNYYTVCWPKAMTAIKGGTLWSFAGKDADMAYLIQEDAPFEAGKPYIIYATAEKLEAVVEGDDAAAGSNNGLYGTLDYMDAAALSTAGATYMLKGNALRPIGTNNHLDANRAYVILEDITGGAPAANVPAHKVRKMPLQDQTTTDCELINAAEAPAKMMINGQLFILRGEKKYDATGRLVK